MKNSRLSADNQPFISRPFILSEIESSVSFHRLHVLLLYLDLVLCLNIRPKLKPVIVQNPDIAKI
jgi:hypothetical protein